MDIGPVTAYVVDMGVSFKRFTIGRDHHEGQIKLPGRKLYIAYADQGGMRLGRRDLVAVGAPGELHEGGEPHGGVSVFESEEPGGGKIINPFSIDQCTVIMDRSSSMNGKLHIVMNELEDIEEIISRYTNPNSNFVLGDFDKTGKIVMPHAKSFKELVDKAKKIRTGHGSNFLGGLDRAYERFDQYKGYNPLSPGRQLCIFFTDGHHNPFSTLEDVFAKVQKYTSNANCILVVVGIGDRYNQIITERMGGHSHSGRTSHFSLKNAPDIHEIVAQAAGKKQRSREPSELSKVLDSTLSQLTNNEHFIRFDAIRIPEAWQAHPQVIKHQIRRGKNSDIHQLGPTIWTTPIHVCLSNEGTDPYFLVALQENMRDTDQNPGEEITEVDYHDLPPEVKKDVERAIREWLKSSVTNTHDPQALGKLAIAGLIRPDDVERKIVIFRSNDRDAQLAEESKASQTDIGRHESIGPDISRIDPAEAESKGKEEKHKIPDSELAGDDFPEALAELDNIDDKDILRLLEEKKRKSHVQGHSIDEGLVHDQSGSLGPLDDYHGESGSLGPPDDDYHGQSGSLHTNLTGSGEEPGSPEDAGGGPSGRPENVDAQSGPIAPLNVPPGTKLPPFRAGAVSAYNAAEPIRPKGASGEPFLLLFIEPNKFEERDLFEFDLSQIARKIKITIGKESGNDIRIKHHSVSRLHCTITREDDEFTIHDAESTNGTLVNNQPVTEQILKDKDIVRLGHGPSFQVSFINPAMITAPANAPGPFNVDALPKLTTDKLGKTPKAQYKLVLLSATRSEELPLSLPVMILGRSPECHVVLDHDAVSRQHCEIRVEGDKVIIRDLHSRNGTRVNDETITEKELQEGDIIKICGYKFKFEKIK